MDIMLILWIILSIILVLSGLAGLILPALPGPLLIFAGLLMAAWAEGFKYVGGITISILAFLAVLAYVADFVAGAFGAKRYGASRRAAVGAAIGAIAGLFFGFAGVILGPFAGAVIGEITAGRDLRAAGVAGFGAWVGMILGIAAKMALGFAMVGWFVIARIF